MKIDLEMLERLVATGANGAAVLAVIRLEVERHETKRAQRRPVEVKSKRKKRRGMKVDRGGNEVERDAATLDDTPRARLFREGKPALLTMNISDSRAGALIVQWLKLTNDDDQLVMATILRAQSLNVADAPSYILATLKGKTDANGTGPHRANSASSQSGSDAIMAGVAQAAERRARERTAGASQRPAGPVHPGDTASRDDLELFGARDG